MGCAFACLRPIGDQLVQLVIAAIGKARRGPEDDLAKHYEARLPWKLKLVSSEPTAATTAQRQEKEAQWLLENTATCGVRIALDERGETLSSREFAALLEKYQTQARLPVGILIGGPDGLNDTARGACEKLISFGRMTWPHLLVRGMLMEQLYRAHSIHQNHPYHRD